MTVNRFGRLVVAPKRRNRGAFWAAVALAAALAIAFQLDKRLNQDRASSPVTGRIIVVDGDTVRVNGQPYRLSGLDTPERGDRARCESEQQKAEAATSRLRQLVATGNTNFQRIRCAGCDASEEGSPVCNYGRLCGRLLVAGRDVSEILIAEGLAHPYVCSLGRCPPRRPWC